MAWTTPRTWVSGNVLTAAQLNTDIRDNSNFLYTPPRVGLTKSATQSISNNTVTTLSFDQEDYDTDAMHSNVSNNSRGIHKTAGVFLWIATLSWDANATGRRRSQFMLNGVTGLTGHEQGPASSGEASFVIAQQRAYAVNDYVEVTGYQSCGSSLNVQATMTGHWLSN